MSLSKALGETVGKMPGETRGKTLSKTFGETLDNTLGEILREKLSQILDEIIDYAELYTYNKQLYIYRVSQNVCAPLKVQIERKLMNKNDLSTIGPR